MARYIGPGSSHSSDAGVIGGIAAGILSLGVVALVGYLGYLAVVAGVAALISAATGALAAIINATEIPSVLLKALGYAMSGGEIALFFISASALYGLATGLIIGLLRTYVRLQSKISESLISAFFAGKVFGLIANLPNTYGMVAFTILTNGIAGYSVGVLVGMLGLPSLFSHEMVGPVLVFVTGAGSLGAGGFEAFVGWVFFIIAIVLMSMAAATIVTTIISILLPVCAGVFGGSLKGFVKAIGIAVIEEPTSNPAGGSFDYRYVKEVVEVAGERDRALAILFWKGAGTGTLSGGITGLIFALNEAGGDPLTLLVGLIVGVCWILMVVSWISSSIESNRK